MRLIHTATLQIQEFNDETLPQYVILSHTWASDEVSYYDFLYLSRDWEHEPVAAEVIRKFLLLKQPRKDSAGFQKVLSCCKIAESRGMEWVWIDTCCIDKSSSSELSEAINSMCKWYWNAKECYVYLADVSTRGEAESYTAEAMDYVTRLQNARWFTRGWALQELLACSEALFYDGQWEIIDSKENLIDELSTITKVPTLYLQDRGEIRNASIAMRMSWASRRNTTRVEDMAYCLLGLFGVSMPLIYGEGKHAFMRLQLELLKKPQDDSIFAWKSKGLESSGMLATWPDAFVDSGNIVHSKLANKHEMGFPYSMTNLGLEMSIPTDPPVAQPHATKKRKRILQRSTEDDTKLPNGQALVMNRGTENNVNILLDCGAVKNPNAGGGDDDKEAWKNRVVIHLQRFGSTWRRVQCDRIESVKMRRSAQSETAVPGGYTVYYIEQPGL